MFRIALKGLMGKKRDTFLLWSVVAFAFIFLVLSTTLITSLNNTDASQRISTYGSWKVLESGLTKAEAESFSALGEKSAVLPMLSVKGADYFAGDNEYYFSTVSPNLTELGQFKLKEGRWPENNDEVILEYAKISAMGLSVGDSFTVASTVALPINPELLAEQTERRNEYRRLMEQDIIEQNLEIFRSGLWELYTGIEYTRWDSPRELMFFAEYTLGNGKYYTQVFADDENPEGKYIPLEEMTEEQFLEVITYYVKSQPDYWYDIAQYLSGEDRETWPVYISDLIGYGDMNIRATQLKSVFSDFDPYYGMANTIDLTVTIPKTYTVCGVIETYSDRWDTGDLPLPCGFILPESYEEFVNAQKAVLEKYPDFEFVEYENTVLLYSEDKAELYGSLNTYFDENDPLFSPFCKVSYYLDENGTENAFIREILNFFLLDKGKDEIIHINGVFVPEGTENPKEYYEESLNSYYSLDYYVPVEYFSPENEGEIVTVENGSEIFTIAVPVLSKGSVFFEYDGKSYEIPFVDFAEGNFEAEGMYPVSERHIFSEKETAQEDYDTFRFNSFAYPSSSEGNEKMLLLVTVILFVTTVCAVFQIFFTQVRKRLRRVVLMKSIGAENIQIAKMYFWEFFFFWVSTFPIGIVFGLGGAYISAFALESIQQREILYTIDPAVFVFSLAAGTFALILGMIIPVIMAVGVPLTGRTARKKPLAPPKKEVQQSFRNVTIRGLMANRSKTFGNAALCVFMMLIMTLCIFIGFRFMTPYRENVQRSGKPEYLLQSSFAMSPRQLDEYLAKIEELGVAESITVYRSSNEAIIPVENAPESVLLKTAFPGKGLVNFTSSWQTGYPVSLHSFNSNSELFEKFRNAVTFGELDPEKFDSGEEVLLLVPLYKETEPAEGSESLFGWENLPKLGIETSYYSEYKNIYERDSAAEAGTEIRLMAETRSVVGEYYKYEIFENNYKIGAVIYYFPEEGIWPISGSNEGWQIICSEKAMSSILFETYRTRSNEEMRALEIMNMASGYGTTEIYINIKENVSYDEADTALLIFSRSNYMDIEFYHESSQKLLNDAINNILLTCLLALTAVLIALMIFANTISSDIEQERNKIGILQSLGVSNRQLIKRQLYIGLAVSGGAVLIANILLWGGIAVYALLSDAVLGNLLWGYPLMLHIIACVVLAGIITVLYILPMKSIQKYLPIENIKTRK